METLEKILYPVAAVAAIVGIYVALRKPNVGPQQSNQISPAASGLPNYTPQAVSYQVNPPQLANPKPLQLLSDPYNAYPGQTIPSTPPAYLAFNYGPGQDLSKIPLTDSQIQQLNNRSRPDLQHDGIVSSSCGCGSGYPGSSDSCSNDPNHSLFPDGRGAMMAQNGRTLVKNLGKQDPAWPARASYNIAGSDIEQANLPYPTNGILTNVSSPPGSSAPAAPNQTFTPASPGANVINNPNVNSAVNPNITPIPDALGRLNQFGNQVVKLSAAQISRATGIPFNTVS